MKNAKRIFKSAVLIIISVLFLFLMSACSADNDNTAEFVYPEKSAFSFETDIDAVTVKSGEDIIINAILKNTSDRDYDIEHGLEPIMYSYNAFMEIVDAIAVIDNFKSNTEISRTLNITAKDSGQITVSADFSVKPSKYSDEFEIYKFEKSIQVNVVE